MTGDVQGREKQIKYEWTGLMSLLNRISCALIIWRDCYSADNNHIIVTGLFYSSAFAYVKPGISK